MKGSQMTITVKQDNAVYILDEDFGFVCSHANTHKGENYYDCEDCGAYAQITDSFYVGTDEWGNPEIREPKMHEWKKS